MSTTEEEQSYEDAFNELVDGDENGQEFVEDLDDEPEEAEAESEEVAEEVTEEVAEDSEPEDSETDAERYRREAEHWQHRYNSDLGRQNALQRKIQELQDENLKLAKTKVAPENMTNKEWSDLKEDYPEIAKGIEARFAETANHQQQELAMLRDQLNEMRERDQVSYKEAQYQILEQQHPDWRDVANSTEFGEWLQQQPKPVQTLVESEDAADAAYLLNLYKPRVDPVDNSDIKQRRERRLKQAQTVPQRGGRVRSNLPAEDDYEASFDYFANQS